MLGIMNKISLIVFAVVLLEASALDIKRIQAYQAPQKKFNADRYGGYWYTQGRYVACSWSGSSDFTDYSYIVEPKDNSYITTSTWRANDICPSVVSNTPLKSPGIFLQKDPIGNMYSGEWVIMATDYKRFSVSWGCSKPSVNGDCADPYISVDTRHPHPEKNALVMIDAILKKRFGLVLGSLVQVVHSKPCVDQKPHYKPHHI